MSRQATVQRGSRPFACGSVLGVVLVALTLLPQSPAVAEDITLQQLHARLEVLERENAQLRQRPAVQPASAETPVVDERAIRELVDQRLKEIEAQRGAEAPQSPQAEVLAPAPQDRMRMSADWKNGVVFENPSKAFRMQFGARFNEDFVAFHESPALEAPFPAGIGPLNNGTFFRRIRLQVKGQMWEQNEFNMEFDFENIETRGTTSSLGTTAFDHMWWGLKDVPVLGTVRVGNQRVPFSTEAYTDSKWLTFMERTAAFDAFLLDFAPGFLATDNWWDKRGTWAFMVHRTTGLGPRFAEVGTGADFGSGEWATTARLTFLPVYQDEGERLLHLGAAYQWRNTKYDADAQADVIRYRARPEIRDSNGFAIEGNNTRYVDTGTIEADNVNLIGAEIMGNLGSWNVRAENYVVLADGAAYRSGANLIPLNNAVFNGGYVQISYILTGEHQPYDLRFGVPDRPKPQRNFHWTRADDGCPRGFGLWEVAARYTFLDLGHIPAPGGTFGGRLSDLNLGLNWWLNPNVRVQWNYVHCNREVPEPNHDGGVDGFGMRFAIDF